MASFQMRQRDPLIDSGIHTMLERRMHELIGIAIIALGLLFIIMLGSYSPTDQGWGVATDRPVENSLGWVGASVASVLYTITGKGCWSIPVILLCWGGRFVLHQGADRAMSRIMFALIAVAMAAVFASTIPPDDSWVHPHGLGGLFGDTVLGALLGISPVQGGQGLTLVTLAIGIGFVAMMLFVTGFNRAELRHIGMIALISLIKLYSCLVSLITRGITRTTDATQRRYQPRGAAPQPVHAPRADSAPPPMPRHSPRLVAAPRLPEEAHLRFENRQQPAPLEVPDYDEAPAPPRRKEGFLGRLRRAVDLVPDEEELPEFTDETPPAPPEDRIKARISDVIRSRTRQGMGSAAPQPYMTPVQAAIARREPSLTRRQPLMERVEPPLMAPLPRSVAAPPAQQNLWHEEDPQLFEDDVEFDPIPARPAPLMFSTARSMAKDPAPYEADHRHAPIDRAEPPHPAAWQPRPVSQNERAAPMQLGLDHTISQYELPPLGLLTNPNHIERPVIDQYSLEENARLLESVLEDYGVKGEIIAVRAGPVVTMYELEPAPGLKASRVIGLADDIARSMSALSARVSTVPGRTVIGIELPNATREKVVLREILAAHEFTGSNVRLPLALGKDISGEPVVANLAKMPHLLIAGTTGSGKSVAINTMILSLLYKLTPDECRLIMIDPKMLELSVYDGIPHLLSPVVTDPKKAVIALKWVVGEMEERYRKMSRMGVRNIEGYNGRVHEALAKGEMFRRTIQTGFDEHTGEPIFETEEYAPIALPFIVIIVDEMADLMMVAGKEIEACIQRLAQMARASGIHLIMATQRPSVDVITGTIKANFPTRISFQVTSKIDSRTILGEQGAEQLLGMGDMLYMGNGARITRIHGPFVSDEEVEEIVSHLKSFGPPNYVSTVLDGMDDERADNVDAVLGLSSGDSDDALYDQAVMIVARDRKCSTSYIQRKLGIGYNKAARLVERMEEESIITRANHVGKREILLPEQ